MFKANIRGRTFIVTGKDNEVVIDGIPVTADVLEYNKGKFSIILDRRSYSAEIISVDKVTRTCLIKVGHSEITVDLKDRYDDLLHAIGIDGVVASKVNDIKAPMPGMVLQVMVQNGQPIKKGDAIVVLEAMKMENILKSPADGIVKNIRVTKGDKVEKNQVMVDLD